MPPGGTPQLLAECASSAVKELPDLDPALGPAAFAREAILSA